MIKKYINRSIKNFLYALGDFPKPESRYYSPRREFRSMAAFA